MRLIYFLALLFTATVFSQQAKLVSSFPLVAETFVGVDSYNNSYHITNNVLFKIGKSGVFEFTDLSLGPITSVDIINPLKVVVFYNDVNTVVFLDNRLSVIDRFQFNELPDFVTVLAATNAGNSRLWIFNETTQQLELFNYSNRTKTSVSQPFEGNLISVASDFEHCYTLTNKKIRLFNRYGSLLAESPSEAFEKIFFNDDFTIALRQNAVYVLTEDVFQPIKITASENPIKDLHLSQEFLYIYDGKFVHKVSLTQQKK